MIFILVTALIFFILLNLCFCHAVAKPEGGGAEPPGVDPVDPADLDDDENFKGDQGKQLTLLKQCYLTSRAKDLALKRFKMSGRGTDKRWPNYANFSTINGPGPKILGRLLSKGGVEPIFRIKQKDIAALVPRIRLFKIYPDGSQAEFRFPAHRGGLGATGKQNIFDSTTNPGDNAGVHSVSYKLAGTNPAEAEKIIQLKLKLFFGSMQDLMAEQITKDSKGRKRRLRYVDLMSYLSSEDAKKNKLAHLDYFEENFRIKIVVGWSHPELSSMDADVRVAVRNAQSVFFLSLVKHDLTFNENGNLDLEIEYNAYMETAFLNPALNIFWKTKSIALQELEKQRRATKEQKIIAKRVFNRFKGKKFEDLSEGDKEYWFNNHGLVTTEERQEIEKNTMTPVIMSPNPQDAEAARQRAIKNRIQEFERRRAEKAYSDHVQENKEKAEKGEEDLEETRNKIRNEKALQKIKRYRRILKLLTEKDRIFTLQVPPEEAKLFNDKGVLSTEQSIANRQRDQKQKLDGDKLDVQRGDKTNALAEADKKIAESVKQGNEPKSLKIPNLQSIVEDPGEAPKAGEDIRIPFFYLGDLFDIVLDIVQSVEGKKNQIAIDVLKDTTLLVGPVTFRDAAKRNAFTLCLTELPVSVDHFLIWFQNNVVKSQREEYLVQDFFNEILKELVMPLFGYGCFDGVKQNSTPHKLAIASPAGPKGQDRVPRKGARCSVNHIARSGVSARVERLILSDLTNTSNILYFFAKEENPSYMRGNRKDDFNNGIYHLGVGRDRGIVKKVNFAKTDFAYRREALIVADAESLTSGGILREKYDATVTTIGNTLFFPGQYIYINPVMPGTNRNVAEMLGFGGYYFVHEVFHKITPDSFDTEIKAVWNAFAQRGGAVRVPREIPKVPKESCKFRNNLGDGFTGRTGIQTKETPKTEEEKTIDKGKNTVAVKALEVLEVALGQKLLDRETYRQWGEVVNVLQSIEEVPLEVSLTLVPEEIGGIKVAQKFRDAYKEARDKTGGSTIVTSLPETIVKSVLDKVKAELEGGEEE